MLEITAAAASREAAIQFLQAVNIATVDEHGNIVPIAEVQITGLNGEWTVAGVDKVHWNMRFYGTSEATLRKPEPEGGWLPEHDLFDRTYINDLVAGRTGLIPNWVASAEDPIPPGYQAGQCRAFDPALIATRANVGRRRALSFYSFVPSLDGFMDRNFVRVVAHKLALGTDSTARRVVAFNKAVPMLWRVVGITHGKPQIFLPAPRAMKGVG